MCGLGRVIHSDGLCKEKSIVALVSLRRIHSTSTSNRYSLQLPRLLCIEIMLLLLLVVMIYLLLLPHLMLVKPELMRIHAPKIYITISAIYSPSIGHSSGTGDFQRRGQGAYTNDANYSHDEAQEVGRGPGIDNNAEAEESDEDNEEKPGNDESCSLDVRRSRLSCRIHGANFRRRPG